MIDQLTQRQLSIVDWDFVERTISDIPTAHWYPGSFAPGLPGVLIDLLSSTNDVVFDPFCGAGSTAVAAILRGRSSICCDINLIGIISGFATTGLLSLLIENPQFFSDIFDDLEFIVERLESQSGLIPRSTSSGQAVDEHILRRGGNSLDEIFGYLFKQPAIDQLKKWYHADTLDQLLILIADLEAADISKFTKVVGYMMLSAVARATSSETRSWGHIADNVYPKEFIKKNIVTASISWIKKTRKQLLGAIRSSCAYSGEVSFRFTVVDWAETRSNKFAGRADLLLTSPPYGGAIDYGLAQRLSLYILGLSDDDISRIVSAEIGARRKRFKPNHVTVWAEQLADAVRSQITALRPESCAVFVMPHKDHGRGAGEALLMELLRQEGFDLSFSVDRSVRQSRTRQSWTSIKKETVLIFKSLR